MGPIRYDMDRGEMWRGEELIRLTATETQLMRIFSGKVGEPIARITLVEELDVTVGRRRNGRSMFRSLGCDARSKVIPSSPVIFRTVRGEGYMLAPD